MRTPWMVRRLRELRVRGDRWSLRHLKAELQKATFKEGGSSRDRDYESGVRIVEAQDKNPNDEVGTTTSDDPANGW